MRDGPRKRPKYKPYTSPSGGYGSLKSVAEVLLREEVPVSGAEVLVHQNKPGGFMCVSCAWAKPAKPHPAEFCENGAKATAWEITKKRVDPDFFDKHTLSELEGWLDYDLEEAGRLTHPLRWDAATDKYVPVSWDDALAEIHDLAGRPRVRAVGETGLDFFRTGEEGRAAQQRSFEEHIRIAKERGIALQIHDRDAHDEVVATLLRVGAPERTVFHCFSGDADMARTCAQHGFWMSFAGPVTFKPNDDLRAAAAAAPAELLLVETDAPFLTPHPYRGRPNEPYCVNYTIRDLAELRGVEPAELAAATTATAERVYGLGQ